ncbi:ERI1 exoribonuclease 2-like [Palaemon carinicauda]|uniref:ERI1 exoribonuclease 2-like n=1 Tax=Palaemon carinicauda TaxID=392227 RepID=UPI0035B625AE
MATKRLALELGLVQKRKVKEGSASTSKVAQDFEFLVVLDFESTCWENGPRMGRQEIIEFPAVLLHIATGEILSEFHHYVMPVEQPILSEFCKNLTGITQDQVEAGVPLGTCLGLFSSWIRKLCDEHQMSFNTSMSCKHVTFATWSDWDLGVCLHYECSRKQLRKPEFFTQWIDIKLTYKNFYQRRPQGLAGALKDLGISFEGREHSGICDTRNTAVLISRMAKDGCSLKITKSLSAKTKGRSVKEAAQKLFNQVKNVILGKRPLEDLSDRSDHSKVVKPTASSLASSKKNSSDDGYSHDTTDCINFSLGLSGLIGKDVYAVSKQEEEAGQSSISAIVVESEKLETTTSLNVCNGGGKSANGSIHPLRSITNIVRNTGKNVSCTGNTFSSPKLLSVSTMDPFKTPALPSAYTGLRASVGQRKSMVETPVRQNMSSVSSVGNGKTSFRYKRTPPFCGCGRRAKLLLTLKPGPNEGRYFFSCPNGGTGSRKNCRFFKWEDEPFVKAVTIDSFCVPFTKSNSKLSAQSLPVQRAVKVNGLGVRGPQTAPAFSKKARCVGLSRNVSQFNSLRENCGKSILTSNRIAAVTQQTSGRPSLEPLEITPYVVREKSRLKGST